MLIDFLNSLLSVLHFLFERIFKIKKWIGIVRTPKLVRGGSKKQGNVQEWADTILQTDPNKVSVSDGLTGMVRETFDSRYSSAPRASQRSISPWHSLLTHTQNQRPLLW